MKTADTIQIFYGENGHDLGGINVKIKRLEKIFPNTINDFNIIYTVDDRVPISIIKKAKARGVKVIQNFGGIYHLPYQKDYQKYNAPIIEIHNELADYIFYQSHFSKSAASNFCKKTRTNSEILYNAVDTEFFKPNTEKKFGYNLLTAGFFRFKSRLEPIIYALKDVLKKYPESHLTIAGKLDNGTGEFDVANYIPNLVSNLKLTKHVTFLGQYSQEMANQFYKKANVFVHAKYKDWCPNVVIEAMASGLPIVFNDTGGVSELVDDCGYGISPKKDQWHLNNVPSLDHKELAEKIILGIDNQEQLSQKSRETAVARFEIKNWISKHLQTCQKILNN